MITSGAEAVPAADLAAIAAQGLPVLCLDTCTALDLVRNPARDGIEPHERTAAVGLLAAVEQGRLVALTAEQVDLEIVDNLPSVEDEAARGLRKLKTQVLRVDALDGVYGGTGRLNLDHLDDHVVRARGIFDRWTACARSARPGTDVAARAFGRVSQGRTPARKGKESMKDCVVVETYLEAVAVLRTAGLVVPIVFASSNVNDYTNGAGSRLRADLALDFATLNLGYASNWAAAKHSLGV